jgi:hypothetical protein
MARDNRPQARKPARVVQKTKNGDGKARPRPPEAPVPAPEKPVHSAIDTLFKLDESVRDAIATNLKERSPAGRAVADRARAAFVHFTPSKHSSAERARPNYLARGDDLAVAQETLITESLRATRDSRLRRSIAIRLTDAVKPLLKETAGEPRADTMDLAKLVDYIVKAGTRPSLPASPAFTSCKAELEAERRMQAFQASNGADGGGDGAGPAAEKPDAAAPRATEKFVADKVSVQMETVTSPESELLYAVPARLNQDQLRRNIQTFELRSGASDVTSYHDFTTLQIAFQSVWTEIFDGQLASLGEDLYSEYVKLKAFAGLDDGVDHRIDTLDDLKALMDEIRGLSRITEDVIPTDLQPRGGEAGVTGPTTPTAATHFIKTLLDPAGAVTGAIGDKVIEAIVDPGGAVTDALAKLLAGKQHLSWSSFPGPLAGGGDVITTTFQEDAVGPGTVEIVLATSKEVSWWKGIAFREVDALGNIVSGFKISNDPRDNDVWDKANYNTLPLYTAQLKNAILEFSKAATLGIPTGYYLLGGLDEKLKDRTRLTFTWQKDK